MYFNMPEAMFKLYGSLHGSKYAYANVFCSAKSKFLEGKAKSCLFPNQPLGAPFLDGSWQNTIRFHFA